MSSAEQNAIQAPRTLRPLYQELASAVQARLNCIASSDSEWEGKHEERIEALVKNHLPSGSGIDSGTAIDLDKSTGEKLVLTLSYHHMDEMGGYDGWTEHTITVRPSLLFGIDLTISGRDRNRIKDYLYEVYQYALTREVEIS